MKLYEIIIYETDFIKFIYYPYRFKRHAEKLLQKLKNDPCYKGYNFKVVSQKVTFKEWLKGETAK